MKKRLAVGIATAGWLFIGVFGSSVAAQYPPTTTTAAPVDASASTTTTAPASTTTDAPATTAPSEAATTTAPITLTLENAVVTLEFPDDVPEAFREAVAIALSEEDGTLKVVITVPCVSPGSVTITFNGQTKEAICELATVDGRAEASGFLLTPSLDGVGSVRFQSPAFNGLAAATFDAPTIAGDYVVTVVDLTSGFETAFTLAFEAAKGAATPSSDGISMATVIPIAVGVLIVVALMFLVAARRRSEAESLA